MRNPRSVQILVVDDDDLVRASLELEAEDAGYRVATAADGHAALELARHNRFDLVVCDIRMPGVDGLEVIEHLRNSQPHAGYIVITGYASPDTPVKALKMRVDDYLLKPFDGPTFLAAVEQVLARKPAESEDGFAHQEALLGILRTTLDDSVDRLRFAEHAATLASGLGFSARRVRTVYLCGLLKDVDRPLLGCFRGLRMPLLILEQLAEPEGDVLPETRILERARETMGECPDPEFSLPEEDWVGLDNLLRLANKHRALGHWGQAEGLYRRMLSSGLSEESELRVKLELFLLSIQRGKPIAELGSEVKEGARALHLRRLESQATLSLARLGECSTDELAEAREVFSGWDEPVEVACCDLLLEQTGDGRAAVSSHRPEILEQAWQLLPELALRRTDESRSEGDYSVKLFGPFRVESRGSVMADSEWKSRKDRMLFAYLCAHPERVITEEELLELLWSRGGEKARHSLHNSVSQIRRILSKFTRVDGKDLIVRVGDGYQVGKLFRTDLALFRSSLERGVRESLAGSWNTALLHLQRADRLVGGDFMEGDYQEWTFPLREEIERSLTDLLSMLGGYYSHRGKPERSVEYWQRVLEIDCCCEEAYESLMELLVQLKKSAEVHRLYLACERSFEEQLGVSVPDRLVQVYRNLSEV
ncbi:MAG: response regulator [Candidatus Eremiobacteraeota bacterium]|nr:response regulator [Candidatus Eremiobacteraeota bacterium]